MTFIGLTTLLCCSLCCLQAQDVVSINDQWTLQKKGETSSIPAYIPGSVQADLLKARRIKDPFIGLNEQEIRSLENEECIYKRRFNIDAKDLQSHAIELVLNA